MVRPLACLLLLLGASRPALAGEVVVARMGERVESSAEQRAVEAATGAAQRPGQRVRVVDLRTPDTGLAEARARQLPQILALRPAVVTLSLGAADLCGPTPLRTFARELHVVTDLLRRNTRKAAVSTLSLPETCARAGPGLRQRLEAFNLTIARTAARNGLVLLHARGAAPGAPGALDPAQVAELEGAL